MKKIKIDDTIYTANTDFRIAIECNRIATDETIGEYERGLGIICTMFGADGLKNPNHYERLLKWIVNYLSFGKPVEKSDEEPDMDYVEDMDYIEASFMSDYHIDLTKESMDWHKFYNLMNGLSNSEMGNCCVLNRIRNLRNLDLKEIKDAKERRKLEKAKKEVALKRNIVKKTFTSIEKKNMEEFNRLMERSKDES